MHARFPLLNMISVFAFSVWLWVCMSVQASEPELLTVKTLKRVDHGNGTLEFIVDFEGGSSTEAVWWTAFGKAERLQGTTEGGTTRLSVLQEDFDDDIIYLSLGDLDRQYVVLDFKTDDCGNRLSELNLTLSTVTPSTDVVYVPGTVNRVAIRADKNRVTSHVEFYDDDIGISLECMARNGTKFRSDDPEFLTKETETSEDGEVINTLIFESDEPINCYFSSVVNGVINEDEYEQSALLMGLWEYTILTIHEECKEIGFPPSDQWDGFPPYGPMN